MNRRTLTTFLIAGLLMNGSVALAQPGGWHGGIRGRVRAADERIERGVRDGSLTHHEARRLRGELEHILRRIDRMSSDGHLDRGERARIDQDLDRLEREIRRERHDDDRRRRP